MTKRQPRRSATLRQFLNFPVHVLAAWIAYRQSKIEGKLNRLLEAAATDAVRDVAIGEAIMALEDDIIAELEAAKTEQAGFLVILKALKDNQGNPAKLQQIAQSVSADRQTWVEAFRENVVPPPPPIEISGN